MISSTTGDLLASFIPFILLGALFASLNLFFSFLGKILLLIIRLVFKKLGVSKKIRAKLFKIRNSKAFSIISHTILAVPVILYGFIYSAVCYFYLDGVLRLIPFLAMCLGYFLLCKIIKSTRKCVKFRHKKCV